MHISNGQYVFGRILLDIEEKCIKTKLVDENSPLARLACLVIEGYNLLKDEPVFEPSPTLIRGYLVEDSAFHNGTFSIVEHKPVEPNELDFPGTFDINPFNGDVAFERGEVYIPLSISEDEAESFEIIGGVHFSTAFSSVILTLMNRTDLTEHVAELKYDDIRFNTIEKQKQIYSLIGEDMSLSYYDLSLKHGFDPKRFYK